MTSNEALGQLILDYDPFAPTPAQATSATEFFLLRERAAARPHPIPWPAGTAPSATPLAMAPDEKAPLPEADCLVVTWTAAEARALAELFTPGYQLEEWYQYRNNLQHFLDTVTGERAPFRASPANGLYYHSLGLYFPCTIGTARVLCLKSGLHMDYDGPKVPIIDWWKQIIDQVKPKLLITTGTGGGIGSDILLGDVVIGAQVRFHCTRQFKDAEFRDQSFASTRFTAEVFEQITAAMRDANASEFADHNPRPLNFVCPGSVLHPAPTIVSTDFFEFDDTLNSAHLQELGQACDMGDASLGLALAQIKTDLRWTAIRNASDGQMDGTLSRDQQRAQAAAIYKRYGLYTSVGSILATWAVIRGEFPASADASVHNLAQFALRRRSDDLLWPAQTAAENPSAFLLSLLSSPSLQLGTFVPGNELPLNLLQSASHRLGVDLTALAVRGRRCSATDELQHKRHFILVQARQPQTGLQATLLFEGDALLCQLVLKPSGEFA